MDSSDAKDQIHRDLNAQEVPISDSQNATPPVRKLYVSQFSGSASLVLRRMKDGLEKANGEILNTPDLNVSPQVTMEENIKQEVVQPVDGTHAIPSTVTPSTQMTLPLPVGPTSATHNSLISGVKRKRSAPVENVDFTQSTVAFPWDDKSRNHPQRQLRKRGGEGDGGVEESPRLRSKMPRQEADGLESLRQRRLAALPSDVVPAKPELVGFGAGRASDSARMKYFSGIKRTDLLNVLSFCDQLKPQLLVDILVSVSKKHPNLPIFNAPDWESHIPSTKASRTEARSRHGHVLINKTRQRPRATKKILKRTRVIEVVADLPGEDYDVMPPTWAKANEGLYAKIPPETEDRGFLLDENDEESFSHFLVDNFGKQIVEAVGA